MQTNVICSHELSRVNFITDTYFESISRNSGIQITKYNNIYPILHFNNIFLCCILYI